MQNAEQIIEEIDYNYFNNANKKDKMIYEVTKRIFDIVFSLFAAIFALPIVILTCILVCIESKGSPIYSQERLGKNGTKFKIYKVRSMYIDAEKEGARWAAKNDNRVTRVGRFIRNTRIDELPQFYNVIKGDMSIIGPRPERPIFTYQFEKETPGFMRRLLVKPGLTGLAQVNGGYDIDHKEKLKLDMEYIKKRGFLLDLKIIFKTFFIVFSGEGAR
ncbi:sugar transferase [Clostridium sp. YIM B02515]|uniref:Sugar transferase n=1 Tax=Clostridium rhizosphaerae TaxID=2803861 RepID=A0ABS1TAH3_9CLOT|nr:sugar transferase [Clostridium rhizosphaerae]MBL4936354.1 sugar transferase [Clostridium rhizosphaerae]